MKKYTHGVCVQVFCFGPLIVLASAGSVAAQTKPAEVPSDAATPGGQRLEAGLSPADMAARIKLLELRLSEIDGKQHKPARAAPTPGGGQPESGTVVVEKNQPATGAKASSTTPEEQRSLQASFVYRDSAPTLDAKKAEISFDANYTRNVAQTQSDRLFLASLTARYGIGNGFELAGVLPYYNSGRRTDLSATGASINESVSAIGDAQIQVSRELWKPAANYPGASLLGGIVAPTGANPYQSFGLTQQGAVADPRSPFSPLIGSRGHWAGITNLQFYKTYDPIIVFFGLGSDYAFEKSFSGNRVQPGARFTYNAGFSFALSEHTTLGAQYLGSLDRPLRVNGTIVAGSTLSESARLRFLVVQRLKEDLYLEPSLGLGLTKDVPNYSIGATLRQRM